MNDLERRYWLDYQKELPKSFDEYHDRIFKILDGKEVDKTFKIIILNDILRSAGTGGDVLITRGIQTLTDSVRNKVIVAVRDFDSFTPDNDPYGEHDFGNFTLERENFYFKIDYYDKSKEYGSEEPSNPSVTSRVTTIMLRDEY